MISKKYIIGYYTRVNGHDSKRILVYHTLDKYPKKKKSSLVWTEDADDAITYDCEREVKMAIDCLFIYHNKPTTTTMYHVITVYKYIDKDYDVYINPSSNS